MALVPFIAGDVYLASSRGGALVAGVGAVAFILTAGRPWAASAAALSALVGSALAVASLHSRPTLLNGPVTSHAASVEGRSALAFMLAAGLVAALLWMGLRRVGRRMKPSRSVASAVIAAVGALLVVAVVLAHPVARFHAFQRPPPTSSASLSTTAHLLNSSGSGRWQLWSAAVDEWRTAKLAGKGAGSFQAWWDQNGSLALPSRDAHSAFLQALAELGLIGFACVAIVWIVGPALGLTLARRLAGSERIAAAAAASVAVAFAVGAAVDWMWQLPAVALVGIVALALALGSASPEQRLTLRRGRPVLVGFCLLVVLFELLPLTSGIALGESRRAAGRADPQAAASAALRARALEPWAVSPVEQLALIDESVNRLDAAQTWIDRARRHRQHGLAGPADRGSHRDETRQDRRGKTRSRGVEDAVSEATAQLGRMNAPDLWGGTSSTLGECFDSLTVRVMALGETLGVSIDSGERHTVGGPIANSPATTAVRFRRDWLRRRLLAIGDLFAIGLATLLLLIALQSESVAVKVLAFAPGWLLMAKVWGLYDRDHRTLRPLTVDELPQIIAMTLSGAALLGVTLSVMGLSGFTTQEEVELWTAVAACVLVTRAGVRALYRAILPRERTLVIGQSTLVHAIRRKLELLPDLNLEIVSELSGHDVDQLGEDSAVLTGIDRIIVAQVSVDEDLLVRLLRIGRANQIKISVVPPIEPKLGTAARLTHVGDLAVIEYHTWDPSRTTILAKRLMDIAVSLTLLVLLSPLILAVALLVCIWDRPPVFFVQERAGFHGEPFRMIKFRTMVADGDETHSENGSNGSAVPKPRDDPRVTRLGRILRRMSLDELPQLINVLFGKMSLVGPRPEQVEVTARYSADQRFRLDIKPGLTGPMQVYGRGALDLGERLALERDYIENMSLTRDIRILGLTLGSVVRGNGAF